MHLNYTILSSDYYDLDSFYPHASFNLNLRDRSSVPSSDYYTQCFLTVQNAIDRAFMKAKVENKLLPSTSLRKFPYPSVRVDSFLSQIAEIIPFFIILAFLYSTKTIIKVSFIHKFKDLIY